MIFCHGDIVYFQKNCTETSNMHVTDIDKVLEHESLHLSEYRKWSGFEKNKFKMKGHGDILCCATCDLETMTPIGNSEFTWFEKLSIEFSCDRLGKIISNDLQTNLLTYYLNKLSKPKIVCYTMSVMSKTYCASNKLFTYGKNGSAVVHYLMLKKYYNDNQYNELMSSIKELQNKSVAEKIQYSVRIISTLQNICKNYNIKFLWTFNSTKTANDYYRSLAAPIVEQVNCKNYIGWVENIDSLPDSSIGPNTQKNVYELFYKNL